MVTLIDKKMRINKNYRLNSKYFKFPKKFLGFMQLIFYYKKSLVII